MTRLSYTRLSTGSQYTTPYAAVSVIPVVAVIRRYSVNTAGRPAELVSIASNAIQVLPGTIGDCRGCGATLHSIAPDKLGYLPPQRKLIASPVVKWPANATAIPLPNSIPIDDGTYLALNPQQNHFTPAILARDQHLPTCARCHSLLYKSSLLPYEVNAFSDVTIPSKGTLIPLLR